MTEPRAYVQRLAFTVPGPPVAWQRALPPAFVGGKLRGQRTPRKTRDYEAHVGLHAQYAIATLGRGVRWDPSQSFAVEIRAYVPDRIRRDVDNLAKSTMDGATGVLWLDDSQVARLVIERRVDAAHPRSEITVEVYRAA